MNRTPHPSGVRSRRRSPWRRRIVAALPLLAFASVLWLKPMGLLLWARIRILTDIPRTAIADPERRDAFPDPSLPAADGAGREGGAAEALPDRLDSVPDCEVGAKSPGAVADVPGTP